MAGLLTTLGLLTGCLGMPPEVKPVDDFVLDHFRTRAEKHGFDLSELVIVEHEPG